MKKVCINQILFFLFAILVISCGKDDNEIAVQSVSLNYPTLDMMVGDTKTLVATILPEEAEQKITWNSSDPKVVTVNEVGVVVAITAGTASVSARTIDGNKSAVCYVTVKAYNIVGHWQQIWSESYKYNISSPDKHEDETSGSVVENNFFYWFKADGTGIDIDGYSFNWSLAGDKVVFSYSGSKYEAKILNLDESALVWEEREADEENSNIIYYEKGTFKKVDESAIPYNPLAGTWMEPYDTSMDEFEVLIWTFRRNWTCDLLWYYFEFPYSYVGYDVENAHYAINKVDQTLTVKEADDEMKFNITIANNNFWTQDMKGEMLNYINYGRDFTNPAPDNVSGYRFTLGNSKDVNLIFENNTHAQFLYRYIIDQPQLNLPKCAYQKKSATTATIMITLEAQYGINGSPPGYYVVRQCQYTLNLFYTGTDVGYCTGKVSCGGGVIYDEKDNQIDLMPAGESKIRTTPFILKKENTAKNVEVPNAKNSTQKLLNIECL